MLMPAAQPILQFGTSRFLQAHADLFVSEALDRGEALGGITVVQTTGAAESAARIAALMDGAGYPVRLRGLRNGRTIDLQVTGRAIRRALTAATQWEEVRAAARECQVILSNTGDRGYELDGTDGPDALDDLGHPPRNFPAKLVVLLYQRWRENPAAPLSLFPCELVSRNGDRLREIVGGLAAGWGLPAGFASYLRDHCIWANSLVDRIVSEPIPPVGAVAEPYALWAIERRAGLVVPCRHDAIVLTDDLERHERLKLFLLNLGHSFLAERWLEGRAPRDQTVFAAMQDRVGEELETVWAEEVLPVFGSLGQRQEAEAYLVELRDRLLNPFLQHRIGDIAQNHAEKKRRRVAPLLALAAQVLPALAQPRLRAMMAEPAAGA